MTDLNAAFFSMHKNEEELSLSWFEYHLNLVGADNIYIIDNGSNEVSRPFLDEISARGAHVKSMPGKEVFNDKGNTLFQWALSIHESKKLDFVLLLDADEFVFSWRFGKPTSDKVHFLAELARLKHSQNYIYRLGPGLANIPLTKRGYFDYNGSQKIMLRPCERTMLVEIDLGLHLYDWLMHKDDISQGYIELTRLGYLHMHHKPFARYKAAAIEKLSGRVDVNDVDALSSYAGPGAHLVEKILHGEDSYYSIFNVFGDECLNIETLFSGTAAGYPKGF